MIQYLAKSIILICLVSFPADCSWGQTAHGAAKLYKEGQELQQKSKSTSDLEKAVQKYEQALAICRKLGDRKGESACLNNIGVVYKSLSQYSKALDYYENSLEISRKIGDSSRVYHQTWTSTVGLCLQHMVYTAPRYPD